MSRWKIYPTPGIAPLSIEQLETGLRILSKGDLDQKAFWDENVDAFRRTVLFAIRETSDALLSPTIPLNYRVELEGQLESLIQYIELADRYVARRSLSREAPASVLPFSRRRIH